MFLTRIASELTSISREIQASSVMSPDLDAFLLYFLFNPRLFGYVRDRQDEIEDLKKDWERLFSSHNLGSLPKKAKWGQPPTADSLVRSFIEEHSNLRWRSPKAVSNLLAPLVEAVMSGKDTLKVVEENLKKTGYKHRLYLAPGIAEQIDAIIKRHDIDKAFAKDTYDIWQKLKDLQDVGEEQEKEAGRLRNLQERQKAGYGEFSEEYHDLIDRVRHFDWYFNYSDDYSVVVKGRAELNKLNAALGKIPRDIRDRIMETYGPKGS